MQAMTKDQAEREYYTLEDAYKSKHPNVSMIRDSWDGGWTIKYTLSGTCRVTRTFQGGSVETVGIWF